MTNLTRPSEELGELEALVSPLMWLETITCDFPGGIAPYGISGFVKAESMPPDGTAGDVRHSLLARAEGILEALDETGWQLTSYPAMEFTGEIRPFKQTIGGELVEPSAQYGIRLRLTLDVNRPR